MNKNKIIVGIIFLALLGISIRFIFSNSDNRVPLAFTLVELVIVSLLILMFFSLLKIGLHLIQLVFHGIPFSDLNYKFLNSSVFLASSVLMFALILPKIISIEPFGKETAAIQTLQNIHRNEAEFYSKKRRFASLDELVDAGYLGKYYRENHVVSGYRFWTSDLTSQTFCIHADRAKKSSGDRDFNISEDGEVRGIYSETVGTVARGKGRLLTDEVE